MENWFDFTVCVASDPSSQLARLEQRGLDRALAEQRISKQLPLARKIELSDLVLWNDGSTAFLRSQVDRIVDSLRPANAGAPFPKSLMSLPPKSDDETSAPEDGRQAREARQAPHAQAGGRARGGPRGAQGRGLRPGAQARACARRAPPGAPAVSGPPPATPRATGLRPGRVPGRRARRGAPGRRAGGPGGRRARAAATASGRIATRGSATSEAGPPWRRPLATWRRWRRWGRGSPALSPAAPSSRAAAGLRRPSRSRPVCGPGRAGRARQGDLFGQGRAALPGPPLRAQPGRPGRLRARHEGRRSRAPPTASSSSPRSSPRQPRRRPHSGTGATST